VGFRTAFTGDRPHGGAGYSPWCSASGDDKESITPMVRVPWNERESSARYSTRRLCVI